MSLTEAGELPLRHAQAIVARLEAAQADFAALAVCRRGRHAPGRHLPVHRPARAAEADAPFPLGVAERRAPHHGDEHGPGARPSRRAWRPRSHLRGLPTLGRPIRVAATCSTTRTCPSRRAQCRGASQRPVPRGDLRAPAYRLPRLPLVGAARVALRSAGLSPDFVFRSDDNGTVQGMVGAVRRGSSRGLRSTSTTGRPCRGAGRIAAAAHRPRLAHRPVPSSRRAARGLADIAREVCTGSPANRRTRSRRPDSRPQEARSSGGRSTADWSVISEPASGSGRPVAGRPPVGPGSRRSPVASSSSRRRSTRWRFVVETGWPSAGVQPAELRDRERLGREREADVRVRELRPQPSRRRVRSPRGRTPSTAARPPAARPCPSGTSGSRSDGTSPT